MMSVPLAKSTFMVTLLIIDPDPEFRKSLEWIHEKFGVKILSASSLSEGTFLFKKCPVDLIVMDMFLPQKSGLSLIAEITSNDVHPPIIATFSADQAPQINIKKFAHMLGVSHTFEKPINAKLFHQAFLELVPHMSERKDN
jgi:two-component system nitrogen regulation response regulator NtrX